jgi:16S rRNA processing protein RimM
VGRAHGLDGSFYVSRAEPDLLREGRAVIVGERVARIERRAGTDARPIVRVGGCASREEAQELHGTPLRVRVSDAPELGAGEYWAHDLAGCDVWDSERRVGRVVRMRALPSVEVLEVERDGGEELLVPLVGDAIRDIDVAARRIEIDLEFLGET